MADKSISAEIKNDEQTAVSTKPKRKRNRPDLANFGQENVESGDNARYIRHAMASFGLQPIDISDEKQVEERIIWYFNHCAEDDMKPSVAGLANALGITRQHLRRWYNELVRSQTHGSLIKKAYGFLEEMYELYSINGKMNPVTSCFMGKNHFGYQDKTEVVLSQDGSNEEIPREALEAKYRDAIMAEGEATIESTAVDSSDY